MEETTCAFTGHRPGRFPWKENEADPRCAALKAALEEQILMLAKAGVTDCYTGGAEGVDLWAAEIILTLREKNPAWKLHCILPWMGQADKWSDSMRERYQAVLERSDSVEYVSREYYDGCMIDRDHRLVESSGLLLAVFRGLQRSGTGATLNYARRLGREIFVLDPLTLSVTHETGAKRNKAF